jgi:superfamily II DNA or RNA helicase
MTALRSNNIILDGSDTGTGKTYTSMALCKQLNLKPFIICPKTIISVWKQVAKYYGVKPLGIVNYELIKNGKYYNEDEKIVECPFVDVDDDLGKSTTTYNWRLPRNSIIIFDEVHKCKSAKTQNGQLLLSTKCKQVSKVLMISATLSDTPMFFHIFGCMLGFYKNMRQANNWIKGMLRDDQNYIGAKPRLSAINISIYPDKGSRMNIHELGNKFPKNQISADCYNIDRDDRNEVNSAFNTMKLKMKEIKYNKDNKEQGLILTEIQKARMKIELLKIPIFEELIHEYIENGYNVVVFVNFLDTVDKLAKKFNTKCIICGNGSLSHSDINKNIEDFQENRTSIIICTIQTAKSGISLHDKHGRPRVSLISPSFSAVDLIQVLGRICRAGMKTPAIQRLIYTAGTCEEVICENIRGKLEFTSKLNDNDLIDIKGL